MSFLKKIFGTTAKISITISEKEKLPTASKKNDTTINLKFEELIDSVKAIGHPDCLLLRREYATSSRIPCQDFSVWISQQLKDKDYNALWSFIKIFYNDDESLQVDIGLNLHDYKTLNQEFSSLRRAFENFLSNDFLRYILAEDKAILELQSFFILNTGINDFNREFWILEGKEVEMLSKILSVYSFQIQTQGFEYLISKANKFLKEMKSDKLTKDYWISYPYYKIGNIQTSYNMELHTDLSEKLKSLSIGERLHFFDYATTIHYKNYWNGDSTYKTRKFGINEPVSLQKIINLNIFDVVNDIDSIPDIASKGELKEKAEQNNFEIKKSWTLDEIFANLKKTDKGIDFLNDFIKDKRILKFKPEYKADLTKLIEYKNKIKIIADILSMA